MESYNVEYYDVMSECAFNINDKTADENVGTSVLELNNGLKLMIDEVTYEENICTIKIVSLGKSTFEGGEVIELPGTFGVFIETDFGAAIFQKVGTESIVDDSIVNYYALYFQHSDSYGDIAEIDATVQLTGLRVKTFSRK